MSVFTVTDGDEAIGWSQWPWEPIYAPAVGVFVSGRLAAAAPCDGEKPRIAPPPSMRVAARVRQRLLRELGLHAAGGVEVGMDGPRSPVWFRIPLAPEVAARLRAGDPAVRLERLEDGVALRPAAAGGPAVTATEGTSARTAAASVESLLDGKQDAATPMDGFAAFLANPPVYQLEAVFLEYLRRLPDPGARQGYLPPLEEGRFTVLTIRNLIFVSEEFRNRRIGFGARLGATLTSPAWRRLVELPSLGPARVALRRFRVSDHDELSTEDFVRAACAAMRGAALPPTRLAEYAALGDRHGRRELADQLARRAARQGLFLEIV